MERASRIELVVAASAILISLASFWLAWQQTEAMDAQVKAMSWPYLQIEGGNYDVEADARVITFSLENAGVGPTRVAWFVLTHDGTPVGNFVELARACCLTPEDDVARLDDMNGVTGDPSPTLIPAGASELVFRLEHQPDFDAFWSKIDRARWKLRAEACHCSILDQCWITDFESEPRAVEACPAPPSEDWRG